MEGSGGSKGSGVRMMAYSSVGRSLMGLLETPPGMVCSMIPAAAAAVIIATDDWGKVAEIAAFGLVTAASVSSPVLHALRRSPPGKAVARMVYGMAKVPRSRMTTRAIGAARGALVCQSSVRDDIDKLRKSLELLTKRGDVRSALGECVHLGPTALMREVKKEGDRAVEAVFVLRGRNNSSWRDGWTDGELHVVADGNTTRATLVSVVLCVEGRQPLKIKGEGHILWQDHPEEVAGREEGDGSGRGVKQ